MEGIGSVKDYQAVCHLAILRAPPLAVGLVAQGVDDNTRSNRDQRDREDQILHPWQVPVGQQRTADGDEQAAHDELARGTSRRAADRFWLGVPVGFGNGDPRNDVQNGSRTHYEENQPHDPDQRRVNVEVLGEATSHATEFAIGTASGETCRAIGWFQCQSDPLYRTAKASFTLARY